MGVPGVAAPIFTLAAAPGTAVRPPTPAERSRELATVLDLQAHRTPGQDAAAIAFDAHPLAPWRTYLGEYRHHAGVFAAVKAAIMVTRAVAEADVKVALLKRRYHQPRPYQMDPRVVVLGPRPGNNTSFPSGHTATGYAAAEVLAALWPERAAEFLATARAEGQARIYSGVHLPSDVAAGEAVGRAAGRHVAADPLV